MTTTIAVFSETGGVGKTTGAIGLAVAATRAGHRCVLIDLDPRAAATRWLGVTPASEGLHIGAILADPDPEGWAGQLAQPTTWSPLLRAIPSDRSITHREAEKPDGGQVRLRASLQGIDADVVIIDCPNRQGGFLTLNALVAADVLVYAAAPSEDGLDGVDGARETYDAFAKAQRRMGSAQIPREAGVIIGGVHETVMPLVERRALEVLRAGGLALEPVVPHRQAVQQARVNGEWFGEAAYKKSGPVVAAFDALYTKVMSS